MVDKNSANARRTVLWGARLTRSTYRTSASIFLVRCNCLQTVYNTSASVCVRVLRFTPPQLATHVVHVFVACVCAHDQGHGGEAFTAGSNNPTIISTLIYETRSYLAPTSGTEAHLTEVRACETSIKQRVRARAVPFMYSTSTGAVRLIHPHRRRPHHPELNPQPPQTPRHQPPHPEPSGAYQRTCLL